MDMPMKTLRFVLVLSVPALLPSPAWSLDPQPIKMAGFQFIPTLSLAQTYDDNFRELAHDEASSWVTQIAPGFQLIAEDRNSAHRLTYAGVRSSYHDADEASHTNHLARLDSIMEFTDRHRLDLEAAYRKAEETTSTATRSDNDKFNTRSLRALYAFGAQSARNRLKFGASYSALRYDNRGLLNADKERDTTGLSSAWFHRLGGNTRTQVEVRHTDYDYKLASSPRNSNNTALLVGATWEATAKTTGKVLVGYEQKEFKDNQRDALKSPMWEVGIDWEPRSYSTFSLKARRAFDEGDDGSDAIQSSSASLAWRHQWIERVSTNLSFGLAKYVYEGQDRDDDLASLGLELIYSPRRWLDVTLGYRYRDNDSNVPDERYQRNIYKISIAGSL